MTVTSIRYGVYGGLTGGAVFGDDGVFDSFTQEEGP